MSRWSCLERGVCGEIESIEEVGIIEEAEEEPSRRPCLFRS
jgi:hypothetical protein